MELDNYFHHHHHQAKMELPEAEDTAFYAELTRQILVLMDEDDETNIARNNRKESPEFQGRSVVASGNYFNWWESGRSTTNYEVPCWMERLWATKGAAGTGVFIPQVVAAGKSRGRRQNKARRNNGGRIHSS